MTTQESSLWIERLESAWSKGSPPELCDFVEANDLREAQIVEAILFDMHYRWQKGVALAVQQYFEWFPKVLAEPDNLLEVLEEEVGYREQFGEPFDLTSLLCSMPLPDSLLEQMHQLLNAGRNAMPSGLDVEDKAGQDSQATARFELVNKIGEGAFGVVYRARDRKLSRNVAIKFPRQTSGEVDDILREARIVAGLNVDGIVPVFDVGIGNTGQTYVVSQLIEGGSLAELELPIDPFTAARWIHRVANALHEAHQAGVIHRDLKPTNILLDSRNLPWIVDFGLAMTDEEFGQGVRWVGTPAWMSPEQARGEGHRVDARSDVFSLGVILYQLVAGRLPWRSTEPTKLMDEIAQTDPAKTVTFDHSIPSNVQQVIRKAMALRASDRFDSAKSFAEALGDLELDSTEAETEEHLSALDSPKAYNPEDLFLVPRGVRTFRRHDHEYFDDLLAGPRDANGVPEAIHFWMQFLESKDRQRPVPVGILYGPTGSGKSSLVQAGLLPRLDRSNRIIFVEASPHDTERDLLNSFSDMGGDVDLARCVSACRRGDPNQKTILVIDQFEQWLSQWDPARPDPVLAALRQCDGIRVQALLLVRDDFWMEVTRLMRELDFSLVERQNSMAIEKFDRQHARRILIAYGRGYGDLPGIGTPLGVEQLKFVDKVIESLAVSGALTPVRIVMVAEIMRGKVWHPETVERLGGISGLGAAFLKQAFSNEAPPLNRLHANASQRVLKALLPANQSDLHGAPLTESEIREVSGYQDHPKEFNDLVDLLDNQLRLVTKHSNPKSDARGKKSNEVSYRLSHDYLVPSIRNWLVQSESSTAEGRARRLLRDRSKDWTNRREKRNLPTLVESFQILRFTRPQNWSISESSMMTIALRRFVRMALVMSVTMVLVALLGNEIYGRFRASALVEQLFAARASEVPGTVKQMASVWRWVEPELTSRFDDEASNNQVKSIVAQLSNSPTSERNIDKAVSMIAVGGRDDFSLLVAAMSHQRKQSVESVRKRLTETEYSRARFQLLAALSNLDPGNIEIAANKQLVVDELLAIDPVELGFWSEQFIPVASKLIEDFISVAKDENESEMRRLRAASLLGTLAKSHCHALMEFVANCPAELIGRIAPAFEDADPAVVEELKRRWESSLESDQVVKEVDVIAGANAAILLLTSRDLSELKLDQMKEGPINQELAAQLIHRMKSDDVTIELLREMLGNNWSPETTKFALLSLGELLRPFGGQKVTRPIIAKVFQYYLHDPEPGVHSAARWALQQWGFEKELIEQEQKWAATGVPDHFAWKIDSLGRTYVSVSLANDSSIAGPATEKRQSISPLWVSVNEVQIGDYYQFLAERGGEMRRPPDGVTDFPDGPVVDLTWYEAVQFCNWLSDREGIPRDQWCYEPNNRGRFGPGMRIPDDVFERIGYRLPTVEEWSAIARGGTSTRHYWGQSDDLMAHYAWNVNTSQGKAHSVGQLKPNQFGVFDILGNAWEWTQSAEPRVDREPFFSPARAPLERRILAGGGFISTPGEVRVGNYRLQAPNRPGIVAGIRPVRLRRMVTSEATASPQPGRREPEPAEK